MSGAKWLSTILIAALLAPAAVRADRARDTAKRIIKFPQKSQTVRFDQISDPVKTHLKSQFRFRRINTKKDLVWRGPSLPRFLAAGCLPYKDHFRASNLRYSKEEQGRDALTEILGTLVQLGMEQGRRLVASGTRLQQTKRHLGRAKKMVKAGQSTAALTSVSQAGARLPTLPKHVRTARKRYTTLSQSDWPTSSHRPIRPTQLVDSVVDVVLQAYNVKTKDGKPASKKALRNALKVGYEAGIEQGKRYFMEEGNFRGLGWTKSRLDMAKLYFQIDSKTMPDAKQRQLEQVGEILGTIGEFQSGR